MNVPSTNAVVDHREVVLTMYRFSIDVLLYGRYRAKDKQVG